MIVKLSIIISGGTPFLICRDEEAAFIIEFPAFVEVIGVAPCGGFNHALGFKMRYHVDEVEEYENEIKLIKEI